MRRLLKGEDAPALRAIAAMPEVSAWWGPLAYDFPLADEPEVTRFTILVDGEIAGRVHHRVTIDPATDNVPAIRCYEKLGSAPRASCAPRGATLDGNLARHALHRARRL